MVTVLAPPAAVTEPASPPVTARRLLTGYYVGLGALMAVWGTRMPAVQSAAHLTPGLLSLVLLASAAGIVAGLYLGGRIAHRHGPARLLTAPAIAVAAALAALGACRTLTTLIAAAACFGVAHGLLDVGANVAAVRCQDAYGRSILSGIHAGFSLGALGGAAAAAATAHISHRTVFLVAGLAAVAGIVLAIPATRSIIRLTPAASDGHEPAAQSNTPRARLWLLGALAAACLLGEGAAADWSAVHLHGLGATAAVSASAYAVYSAAMAAGRLAGDRLIARYGAPILVRMGAVLATAGLAAGLLADAAPAALAGWAALGLGLSATVPALITAAGRHGPRAVAAVTTTGYLGLLAGPAVIGALASLTGSLPAALALPVLLAAVVAAASRTALETSR
ncbi:MFS transporter [Streptomyces sp. MI02-7b]|uniref:MFS transporter n=1 Tax=Streptomyces sp. MI02-7b TaxID=462941 RepID=UPI0029A4C6F3|nr:MFS transporter [Streptomyces sp. MI02-7b]MDX3075813.1 MFS transporter [Streptomyces sp. MI02-7b]